MSTNRPFPFSLRSGQTNRAPSPDGRWNRAPVRIAAAGAFLFALIGAAGMRPLAPALAPDTLFLSLDRLAKEPDAKPNPIENPRETFTGSAFFFAADAFTPSVEATASGDGSHVWALRKVDAALTTAFAGKSPLDQYRAINCLTSAIYYEAANEPEEGQRAVAQVVLNRVRHPAWPGSICAVVYQGSERADMLCQFTFSCDGAMARAPVADKWARARRVAEAALGGQSYAPVGMATFYHTLAVRPEWSSRLDPVAVVGAHIFYQMRGVNGTRAAFHIPYSGREAISGPAPRVWKPVPAGAIPQAMPYTLPDTLPVAAPSSSSSASPAAPAMHYPVPGGSRQPTHPVVPGMPDQNLPRSDIRPEYRDSGQPLI